jgi:hypothetical protein
VYSKGLRGFSTRLAHCSGGPSQRPSTTPPLLPSPSTWPLSCLYAAVARVNRGLPAKPEHPGGLCRISKATLHRHLKGEWKGSSGPAVHSEPSAPQGSQEDAPEPGATPRSPGPSEDQQ